MGYLGEERINNNNNNTELIKKIINLINRYKEALASRGDFVDKTPEEIEKTRAILQAIEKRANRAK